MSASIVIEQTQSEMQESHAFSRKAEIAGIKISSAAFSTLKPLTEDFEEALSVAVRYAPQDATIEEGCCRASTLFECVITEAMQSEVLEPIAKFECSLTATYNLHSGYIPSKSELDAFHKGNVIFNCWPYFREFIQNAACRMNFPPPPIPFVRVQIVSVEPSISVSQPIRKTSKKTAKRRQLR